MTMPSGRPLIVGIVGIACGVAVVLFLIVDPFSHGAGQAARIIDVPLEPGIPVRLRIPKIKVDSALERVGLTPEGAVGVPKGPVAAAWFDRGPRPGATGTAIIDGHFGWKDNIPAVFDHLSALRKGDTIFVEDEKGVTIAFTVRAVRSYGQHEDASSVFGVNDGKAYLNLITCGGTWSKAQKSYSHRIVVFADRLEE